jgi:hypothetical protein
MALDVDQVFGEPPAAVERPHQNRLHPTTKAYVQERYQRSETIRLAALTENEDLRAEIEHYRMLWTNSLQEGLAT